MLERRCSVCGHRRWWCGILAQGKKKIYTVHTYSLARSRLGTGISTWMRKLMPGCEQVESESLHESKPRGERKSLASMSSSNQPSVSQSVCLGTHATFTRSFWVWLASSSVLLPRILDRTYVLYYALFISIHITENRTHEKEYVISRHLFETANRTEMEIEESKRKPANLVCIVCRAEASDHFHYGAICCFSCRAFFRRYSCRWGKLKCVRDNIRNADPRNFVDCPVNEQTRNDCMRCRLKKCFDGGMKKVTHS